MALDPKAVEVACKAHAPMWDGIDPEIQRYAREQMKAAITAYLQHAGEAEPVAGDASPVVKALCGIHSELLAARASGGVIDPRWKAWEWSNAILAAATNLERLERAAAPHPHQAPEGWVLVPREPTQAMCAADAGTSTTDRLAWNAAMYRAMIAASPSKQASASADQGGE